MRPDEMSKILHRRPFEPIRLHMSNGEHVDIRHPEMALVTRSAVVLGVSEADRPNDDYVADYTVHYNLLHIVKIERINGQPPSAN